VAYPLPNYLRAYRKRTGLSQEEVAFLLGAQTEGKVLRHERGERQPSLRSILAYQLILGAGTDQLFAGLVQDVSKSVSRRARVLARRLDKGEPSRLATRKLEFLGSLADRRPREAS
jgi:transcriptional regulator with XRE-family HTH domain